MKVQISENQFLRILNEKLKGKDLELDRNDYLNNLLDRIKHYGINSLTPEETKNLITLSQGGTIEEPESNDREGLDFPKRTSSDFDDTISDIPHELNNYAYKLFIDLYPETEEIDVNGQTWYGGIAEEGLSYPYLKLASNDQMIKVIPFYQEGNDYKLRMIMDDIQVQYNTTLVPESDAEMYEFIDKLNDRALSSMITKILQEKEKRDRRGNIQ